jgi:hypothetical protein
MKIELTEQQIDIILQSLENATIQVKSARIVLDLIDGLIKQYQQSQHQRDEDNG